MSLFAANIFTTKLSQRVPKARVPGIAAEIAGRDKNSSAGRDRHGSGDEAPPTKRRRKHSSDDSDGDTPPQNLRHVEFDYATLLDVCESAARGIKDVNATMEDQTDA